MADVTLTVTIQVLFAGMVAPESASEVPPAAAVTTPSGQVVAPPGAAVFCKPAGYVSVNAAAVMSTEFGFVKAIVNNEVPFCAIANGENVFTTLGAACTISVAILLGVPGVGNPVYDAPLV